MLLFALVLGLTALAAAVSPTRDDSSNVVTQAAAPPAPPQKSVVRTVPFASGAGAKPLTRTARTGEHLLLSVDSSEGGLVTIPLLGLTASAGSAAPATFDVLAPAAGRYDLLFSGGGVDEPRRVGTLVTHP